MLWKNLKRAVNRRSPHCLIRLEHVCREEWNKFGKSKCIKLVNLQTNERCFNKILGKENAHFCYQVIVNFSIFFSIKLLFEFWSFLYHIKGGRISGMIYNFIILFAFKKIYNTFGNWLTKQNCVLLLKNNHSARYSQLFSTLYSHPWHSQRILKFSCV